MNRFCFGFAQHQRRKTAVIFTVLILLLGISVASILAMAKKPPMPVSGEKPTLEEKTYTEAGKTYKILTLKDIVKPEDILFDKEIDFKKEATLQQIGEILKKLECEIIHRNDEDKIYMVKMPKSELTSSNDNFKNEPLIFRAVMNRFAVKDYDYLVLEKHLNVEFTASTTEEKKNEIISKYQTKMTDVYNGRYTLVILSDKRIPEVVNQFRKDMNTKYAEPVYMSRLQETTKANDIGLTNQWYLDQINDTDIDMPEAWGIITSTTVIKIAVIDSGVSLNYPELKETIIVSDGCNLVQGEDKDIPQDKLGHGTGICGIIGAQTNNIQGISGICWNREKMVVKILPVKVTNTDIYKTEFLVKGIEYAIEEKVDIINISSESEYDRLLKEAIDKAIAQRIIVVCASGNENIEIKTDEHSLDKAIYPACYEGVVCVGGVNRKGDRTKDSNYGDAIDVFAPAEEIYMIGLNNACHYDNGTSFSAAIVTGIVGLMKSEDLTLTNTQITQILKETTKNNIVNAYNAIKKVQELKGIQKGELEVNKDERLAESNRGVMGITQPGDVVKQDRIKVLHLGEDEVEVDMDRKDYKQGILIKQEEKLIEEKKDIKLKIKEEKKAYISNNNKFNVKVTNIENISESKKSSYKTVGFGDSKIEYFNETGDKVWEIKKPKVSIYGCNVSNNGEFIIVNIADQNYIGYIEIYNKNKNLILKREKPSNMTISPSGNIVFFEESKGKEKYLSCMNLNNKKEWNNLFSKGHLEDISLNDEYYLYKIGTTLYLHKIDNSLVWEMKFNGQVKAKFSLDSKIIICSPSSFIPYDNKIYLIDTVKGEIILNLNEIRINDDSQEIIIKPDNNIGVSLSLDNKYISIGSRRKKGEDFVYITLLDIKGNLLWYDKIDIKKYFPIASPRFSQDNKLLIVTLYENPPDRIYIIDDILR